MSNPPAPPSILSRPDAQQVIDWLNLRVYRAEERVIDVTDGRYGAKGNGSTDDTEAVKKAKEALGKRGGTIFFPYGEYKLSGQLNFDETRTVRLLGAGGPTGGSASATKLLFTQTGSEPAISAKSSSGFTMADLGVFYSSGEYTGYLLDLSHGAAATDSAYSFIERCQFTGLSVRSAKGINYDKAIICAARGTVFDNLDVGAVGQKEKERYSNSIRFDACMFTSLGTVALKNAGEAWYVSGCTFEALHSGAAGAYTFDTEVSSQATTFTGCWLGDVTGEATSTWINWRGSGLTVQGCLLGGNSAAGAKVTLIEVPTATSTAVSVTGNRSSGGATNGVILAEGVKNYIVGANEFSSITGKKVSVDGGATDKGEGFLSN